MKKTPVTYFPPVMQKQLIANQESIRGKTFEKFFLSNLVVPVTVMQAIQHGPIPAANTFPPTADNINRLFDDLDNFPIAVYGIADDGENGLTTFNLNRHFMPGVTVKMMEWWFTWHVQEKERYSLWFPHAHVANSVSYPERMTDESLSYAEKLYGNPNHITEYVGSALLDAVIHFTDPIELGLDKAVLDKHRLTFSASGWSHPFGQPELPNALMLHIGRDVAGGFELYSGYFIGAHKEWSRFPGQHGAGERVVAGMKAAGVSTEFIENGSYEMAVHDMTEFTHLAAILPALYAGYNK